MESVGSSPSNLETLRWLPPLTTTTKSESIFFYQVYTWTTANQLFIKGCATSLVIGASTGKFGLWFDEDLNKGRSQECATFGNPSLTPSSDFSVNCIEVWAFQHST